MFDIQGRFRTTDNAVTEVQIDTAALRMVSRIIFDTGEIIELDDRTFQNLTVLSAELASRLPLQFAIELLTNHNVDKNSQLWFLNHSNPWRK